jgi:hypothetical protein
MGDTGQGKGGKSKATGAGVEGRAQSPKPPEDAYAAAKASEAAAQTEFAAASRESDLASRQLAYGRTDAAREKYVKAHERLSAASRALQAAREATKRVTPASAVYTAPTPRGAGDPRGERNQYNQIEGGFRVK